MSTRPWRPKTPIGRCFWTPWEIPLEPNAKLKRAYAENEKPDRR